MNFGIVSEGNQSHPHKSFAKREMSRDAAATADPWRAGRLSAFLTSADDALCWVLAAVVAMEAEREADAAVASDPRA